MSDHPFATIGFPSLPAKPRTTAVTSVLDKGLGPDRLRDALDGAGDWVDVVKLGWASARMTSAAALAAKIAACRAAGARVCTGGTFLEIALAQDKVDDFLASARELGIDMVEVSNGIHPMTEEDKLRLIARTREAGFGVWSEVGRKDPEEDARLPIEERIAAAGRELDAGADKVVLEARESGTVGIYDFSGKPAIELIHRVVERIGLERLVFEAPLKSQQVWMIRHFGREVNLGNVPVEEAIPLATLRTGLRGDTFADVHLSGVEVFLELGVNGALEARERGGVVVMIDALRASATIATALACGMRSVVVVATAEECVGDVTAGERGGKKLAHVRHGNSPTEIRREDYRGKQLVLTTSNGAEVLLTSAGPDTEVLVGSMLNASAVARAAVELAHRRNQPITLLMAGRNNGEAVEDELAAAEILGAMRGVHMHGQAPHASAAPESDFFAGASGANLAHLGYADDVRFCAQTDVFDVVPVFRDGALVPLT